MEEEDEYEEDEFEEDEEETETHVRTRPTHHVTTVTAHTEAREGEIVLFWDGKTTGVSSGSAWGGCQSWPNTENIAVKLKEIVQSHNKWCDSWQLDDGTVKHGTDTFESKITLDGKPILMDGSASLTQWFK